MCGSAAPTSLVEIDHVELYACPKCSRFGKPVMKKRPPKKTSSTTSFRKQPVRQPTPQRSKPPKKDFLHDKILVDAYGRVIINARRERGIGRAELANKIKEKETLLARIEAEKVLPTDRVVAKIERELGIELKTEMIESSTPLDDLIPKSSTIGSIAKIKRKKK